MVGVELGRVDRLLQVHPEIDVAEERVQRPLLLLVAARSPPGEVGLAVAERQTRAERRARARSGAERRREALLEPEHLRPRSERPAERGNDRRALQPAAARRRRDHVPEAVGDVEMNGAATGLAGAGGRRGSAERREPADPRPVLGRRLVADEGAPLVVVLRREERLERDLLGVAVQRVAIRERELSALDDHVDELGGRELGEVEALQQRELLEARPARPPTAASCRPSARGTRSWRPARSSRATQPCPRP